MITLGNIILGLKIGKSKTKDMEHTSLIIYLFPFTVMFIINNQFTDFRIELFSKICFSISLLIR